MFLDLSVKTLKCLKCSPQTVFCMCIELNNILFTAAIIDNKHLKTNSCSSHNKILHLLLYQKYFGDIVSLSFDITLYTLQLMITTVKFKICCIISCCVLIISRVFILHVHNITVSLVYAYSSTYTALLYI